MESIIKILHLEDLPEDAELIDYQLKRSSLNFEKKVVDNKEDYIRLLTEFKPDIILSDHSLPSFDSVQALRIIKEQKLNIPFILITATVSEEFAVDIMKQGASDYILKDRLQRLPSAVINSIEKTRMEEEQQSVRERLLLHIENTPLGLIEWNENGLPKIWSKRAEEIFGWTGTEFTAEKRNWFNLAFTEDLPWVSKVLDELMSGQVERNKIEYRNQTKDGRLIWCEWFNSVLKNKDGSVKTIMSLVQDITEQKQLERQKDDFISMASHELKTPVTTIKAYGYIAESMLEEKGEEEVLDIMKRMGNQVDKLTTLIVNLLDFTRIQKGKLVYNETTFDFNDLVTEVIGDMQKTSYVHDIQYNSQVSATIFGDRDKLTQVINNLISNAIKYSPYSDKVIMNTELDNHGIELSIQDFGIGISSENQENIFKQFYRIEQDSHSTFPGLGIGLYICAEIIASHGGKIWAESTFGKGSVFHIWLPLDHRNMPV